MFEGHAESQKDPHETLAHYSTTVCFLKEGKITKTIFLSAHTTIKKPTKRLVTNLKEIYTRSAKLTPNGNRANLAITTQLSLKNDKTLITYILTLIISITNVEEEVS